MVKSEQSGVSGVYLRRFDLTIQDVQMHRRLSNYLLRLYRRSGIAKTFSPISNQILCSLPTLAFAPAFLQVYSLCRFNELNQISLESIKSNSPFKIISSKGEHERVIPPLPLFLPALLRSLDPRTKTLVTSYDKYKHDIKVCLRFTGFQYEENILDCTHIFRHLEATWKISQGCDIHFIGYSMGHKSLKTTGKYIHKKWKF